jgi:anti-sigma factor RsiW
MTDRPSPLSDLDLHAYVDDRLDGDRRAEVEALLAGDPDSRSRVEDYKAQTEALHDLFDGVLDEQVPAVLVESATAALAGAPRRSRRSLIASLAAAIALFLVGGGIGWFAHDLVVRDGPGPAIVAPVKVAEWALTAHVLYTPEVLHPVEVVAAEEAHLVAWLTKRLGGKVRAPRLGEIGYSLVGGRLLPSPGGPAAQFMYQDAEGGRLTLYVSSGRSGNLETAFRYVEEGPVGAFYWIDGAFGYALVGEIEKNDLLRGARLVYNQLTP